MSTDGMEPPEGVAPEILAAARAFPPDASEENDLGCDAYALWAAMTRLSHEVKLQGRAFAALRDAFSGETKDSGEAERRAEAACRRAERLEEELLTTLADVYDRLARSLEVARRRRSGLPAKRGWLAGLLSRGGADSGVIDSLVEGQELALRRVGDELGRRGVREIAVMGERFDPEIMRAVATDSSGELPDGTVTGVVRCGWRRGDVVWRVAEVTVARR